MSTATCLNCGQAIAAENKFCGRCGQKANISRISFRSLLDDALYVFVHTDKGLLNLFKGLLIRPGRTAANYAEGQRKKYFNPISFLAICIGLMLLLNSIIKPYGPVPVPDKEVVARITDLELRDLYITSIERIASVQEFTNKNLSLISVLVAPYFALFLWLFFRERKRNMAEITLAYILFNAVANLIFTIIFSPLLAATRQSSFYYPIMVGGLLIQTFYYAWGMKTFLGMNSTSGFFKVLGVLLLAGFIGLIILVSAYFLYVYHGGVSKVLRFL